MARSGCAGRLWALILLRRDSVFIDFAAREHCFVKVALGASLWCSWALRGTLAVSTWCSWNALGTFLGCSWAFLGRSGVLLAALGALLGRFGVILALLGCPFHRFFVVFVVPLGSWGGIWVAWVQTNAPTNALTIRLAKKIDVQQDVLPQRCLSRSFCIDASCLKSSCSRFSSSHCVGRSTFRARALPWAACSPCSPPCCSVALATLQHHRHSNCGHRSAQRASSLSFPPCC